MSKLNPAADAIKLRDLYLTNAAGVPYLPVDPFSLAEAFNIPVYSTHLIAESRLACINWDDDGAFIAINETLSYTQQRFACARVLGHFWDVEHNGRSKEFHNKDSTSVAYANDFATALLMPADLITQQFEKGVTNPDILARIFRVSERSMRARMTGLGLNDATSQSA